MNPKTISFMAMMGALGNLLFVVSYYLGPISYGVALDFSLLPTFIAAVYGGPVIGLVTGLFVGILPGIYFGPLGSGAWLGLIGLPLGKALTGLAVGLIARGLKIGEKQHSSLLTTPAVLLGYIPEFLYTLVYFIYLMPYFLGTAGAGFLAFVVPKAWAEVLVMSVLMAALVGNVGFNNFVNKFFKNYSPEKK